MAGVSYALDLVPALDRPDLLADPVKGAISSLALPDSAIQVAEISIAKPSTRVTKPLKGADMNAYGEMAMRSSMMGSMGGITSFGGFGTIDSFLLLILLANLTLSKTSLENGLEGGSLLLLSGDDASLGSVMNDERQLLLLLDGSLESLVFLVSLLLDGLLTLLKSLAALVSLAWEDNQLVLVGSQTLDVALESGLVLRVTTIVNGNSGLLGGILGQASSL